MEEYENRVYDPDNLIEAYNRYFGKPIFYLFEGGIQEIEISNNYRLEDIEDPPQTDSSQLEKAIKAN